VTLIELMIVVVIIGVLAAIATYAYGRLTKRNRINDAVVFMSTVAGAQGIYRQQYGEYGSTDQVEPFDAYDPAAASIRAGASPWSSPDTDWGVIGVQLPGSTYFQYLVVAGQPSGATAICKAPPDVPLPNGGTAPIPACASVCPGNEATNCTPGTFWYYIIARGDQDGDGYFSVFGSSSTMERDHWALDHVELE
jgi:prepilin-type N-terminal cleavage/methylation domain-containing protein